MRILLSCLLILLYSLVSCQKQPIINDLQFSNYSGHPKKVTEVTTFSNQNTDKRIFYFDKDGFLTKTESYNLIHSENPGKRLISEMIIYDSKDKAKRYFETIKAENKKVIANGYFERISDSLYKRVSNSETPPMSLGKLFHFDKNNRLVQTEETGNFNGSPINNAISYRYKNTVKSELLFEDIIQQRKSKLTYRNVKTDRQANPVYEELFDESGTLQQKTEREFEYY
ncbi:MAG: hypothetical protein LBE92_20660 [Chryseobacterium sp.]|uniref:hypothetical protein n=1 Tax=Chryseobacterium sp. TaxID=1871047 RepID=UPI00283617DA|nr:hypothetical protein [Chryseobacterium sp.]MDR2238548.1 hypothetical protein [Chryseobacterium sp.]